MNETTTRAGAAGLAAVESAAAQGTRPPDGRAVLSTRPAIAAAFTAQDTALSALPWSFIRAARSLADRLDCREQWDAVETTHANLREHVDQR